ncbi:hypothetical protein KW801_03510 [Candidatus Saccharibacteria bacterium]|nr:hypothetical protein [Candidatus Saccharibacteria bacterium]
MMNEKEFLIGNAGPNEQYVIVSRALGRILMRDEVAEIIGELGSTARSSPSDVSIEITPPIPEDKLPKLGEALVELASSLDPTPPLPTYKIV